MKYAELMSPASIFRPLGMNSTSVFLTADGPIITKQLLTNLTLLLTSSSGLHLSHWKSLLTNDIHSNVSDDYEDYPKRVFLDKIQEKLIVLRL